jgi:hypothetical protein
MNDSLGDFNVNHTLATVEICITGIQSESTIVEEVLNAQWHGSDV